MRMRDFSPQRVRQARIETGLSQSRLARLLGVTEQSVSNWESGRVKRIRLLHLRELARITDRSMEFFLEEEK